MSLQRPFAFSRFFFPSFPERLRARIGIGASFFIQGVVFATWCARIPDIRRALELNEAQLGGVLLMAPLGQFLAMVPNGLLVTRFGSRAAALTVGLAYPLILPLLSVARTPLQLGASLFLMGVLSNLSYTAVNTQGIALERLYDRSIMALFHGMWSVAGAVTALVAMFLAMVPVSVPAHFIGTAAACVLLLLFSGGTLLLNDESEASGKAKASGGWKIPPELVWLGVAAFGCMACEGAVYDWSGVYMEDVAGAPDALRNVGYFAYLCVMVAVRLVADRLTDRFGHRRLMLLSGSAIALGYLTAVLGAFVPGPAKLICVATGMAVIGSGTSAVVPLCCSLAGRTSKVPTGIAITEISTIGFFGFLFAPPVIGFVAHGLGLRTAFLLMVLLGCLIVLAAHLLRSSELCAARKKV